MSYISLSAYDQRRLQVRASKLGHEHLRMLLALIHSTQECKKEDFTFHDFEEYSWQKVPLGKSGNFLVIKVCQKTVKIGYFTEGSFHGVPVCQIWHDSKWNLDLTYFQEERRRRTIDDGKYAYDMAVMRGEFPALDPRDRR